MVSSKTDKYTIYKNKYCAYCHNESDSNLSCYFAKMPKRRGSLQLLFDVSELFPEKIVNKIFEKLTIINDNQESGGEGGGGEGVGGGLIEIIKDNSEDDLSEKIKKYMTIVGLIISILSILALLVIYATNKALRNFPGKLLICLSLSILLSQLFFLVSIYITESKHTAKANSTNYFNTTKAIFYEIVQPCYVLSVLTHFFYLGKFNFRCRL